MSNPTTADLRKLGIKIPATDRPRAPFIIDEATRAVCFDVPVRTKAETNNDEHWRVKQRRVKEQFAAVDRAMAGLLVPPLPVTVTFTRRSAGTMDEGDNLNSASKHLRDRIAALYGTGDSPSHPIAWDYKQEKCKAGDFSVRVTIVKGKP